MTPENIASHYIGSSGLLPQYTVSLYGPHFEDLVHVEGVSVNSIQLQEGLSINFSIHLYSHHILYHDIHVNLSLLLASDISPVATIEGLTESDYVPLDPAAPGEPEPQNATYSEPTAQYLPLGAVGIVPE